MTILLWYLIGGGIAAMLLARNAPDYWHSPSHYEIRRVMVVLAFGFSWFAVIGIFVYMLVTDLFNQGKR